jgi:glycosyltransferase involved in cell wall biosynthesis
MLIPVYGESSPEVCIAIPAFNEAAAIDALLENLLSQPALATAEILVCNNGSSDHTREVVEVWQYRSARVRLISEPVPGKPAAWNALMRGTSAGIIVFLDADTIPQPGSVERMIEAARQSPHLAFAGRRHFVARTSNWTRQCIASCADPVVELCLAGNFYALRREPMLARLRDHGFERMPNVFAEDIWLQALLERGELRRVDAAVEIVVDTLPAYLELHARKRLVLHELRWQYPELAGRLEATFPEALLPWPQLRAVLAGDSGWITKGRWVAGGAVKTLVNLALARRIARQSAWLRERLQDQGGARVLRHFTLRRQAEAG